MNPNKSNLIALAIVAALILGVFIVDTYRNRTIAQPELDKYKVCVNNAISNTESPNISIANYANPIDYGNDIEYKLRDDIIGNVNKCD